jgi:hypothetical protein
VLHLSAGECGKAEPLLKEALSMDRALYPEKDFSQGHPYFAASLINLAALHSYMGEYGKAETLYREAMAMYRSLALRYANLAAEAEALNYLATQQLTRDAFLSVSRHRSASTAYDAVWDSRAALTRLQERRHRDLMATREKDTADLAVQLRRARFELARRLLHPLRDPEQQRATVQQLTDAKEDLEKRIAARLKLAPGTAAASATPKELAQALPNGTAFLDLYRYTDFEQDLNVKGKKGKKRTLRYVAFVLRPGQSAVRVELKEAVPIDDAWAAWQKALTADRRDDKAERESATRFAELVWQPIGAVLPRDLKTFIWSLMARCIRCRGALCPARKPTPFCSTSVPSVWCRTAPSSSNTCKPSPPTVPATPCWPTAASTTTRTPLPWSNTTTCAARFCRRRSA